jgi:hypothetical protein
MKVKMHSVKKLLAVQTAIRCSFLSLYLIVVCSCDYSSTSSLQHTRSASKESVTNGVASSLPTSHLLKAKDVHDRDFTLAYATSQMFDELKGIELEYPLFIPNSMIAWELSDRTRLRYQANTQTYVRDKLIINQPTIDDLGPRFKICSTSWTNQWGFGKKLIIDESTFGISVQPAILTVDYLGDTSTDMYIEYSRSDLSAMQKNTIKVEFKVLRLTPKPLALMRVSLD